MRPGSHGIGALLLVLVAVAGPWLAGAPDAPSIAPSAAQLLPPGTRVEEVRLSGGGYLRGLTIEPVPGGVRVRAPSGWRTVRGIRPAGPVYGRIAWLGTDHQGRDLLARLVAGARVSLSVAVVATLVAVGLGSLLGLVTSGAPSPVRAVVGVVTDALIGIPRIVLLLMLGVAVGAGLAGIGLAIGLASWMDVARLVEAEARSVAARPFLAATAATGTGFVRRAMRHVVPNVAPVLAAAVPLVATQAILTESTLSFLGISSGPSTESWGRMIADGQRFLPEGWWIAVCPGLLLCGAAMAFHELAARPVQRRDRPLDDGTPSIPRIRHGGLPS